MSKRPKRHARERQPGPPNGQKMGARSGAMRMIDFAVEPVAPPSWPPISVCMIVKDEAHNLRPCIGSLGDLASEIVVVDTGSTDDTVRVATELGARVFHFPWVDDFSAARNESLRHATGEWVFWVDADDRLGPRAVAQLKSAAASGKADAYMCRVVSQKASGSQDCVDHARLFRNGLGLEFSGAIHETIWHSLSRLGLCLASTSIRVDHVGYESAEALQQKARRNLAVIDSQLKLDPSQTHLLFYRGQTRGGLGQLEGAERDLRDYLLRTPPHELVTWERSWAYVSLAEILERLGKAQALGPLLEQAASEFPRHPHFLHLLGMARLEEGQPSAALDLITRALEALDAEFPGFRPPAWPMEMSLAAALEALDQPARALPWARSAWEKSGGAEKAGILLVGLLLRLGLLFEAEEALNRLLPGSTRAEVWLHLAQLRRCQGRESEAVRAEAQAHLRDCGSAQVATKLQEATQSTSPGSHQESLLQQRGLAHLAQGDLLKAAESFAEATESHPSNPDNYRYLAVALKKLGRHAEAADAWQLALRWESHSRA